MELDPVDTACFTCWHHRLVIENEGSVVGGSLPTHTGNYYPFVNFRFRCVGLTQSVSKTG